MNLKILAIILLILCFGLSYLILKKKNFIENYSNNKISIKRKFHINNKNFKYIFIKYNSQTKFYFLNFDQKKYMTCEYDIIKYKINFKIFNNENKQIGKFINDKYNKITLNINYYKNPIIIEFLNNFSKIKCYIENDEKWFYIYKIDTLYSIDIYQSNIGYIDLVNEEEENLKYKINIQDEYKKYLNLIGLGLIFLIKN